mgnify:FL=1
MATAKIKNPSIWRSRLGWSITLIVFLTILVVQSSFSFVTLTMFEEDRKADMREFALSSVIPMLDTTRTRVLSDASAERILNRTRITGISIYETNGVLLRNFGQLAIISPNDVENTGDAFLSKDRQQYEMLFYPVEIGVPNILAVRVDSSALLSDLEEFIILRVMISVLL